MNEAARIVFKAGFGPGDVVWLVDMIEAILGIFVNISNFHLWIIVSRYHHITSSKLPMNLGTIKLSNKVTCL